MNDVLQVSADILQQMTRPFLKTFTGPPTPTFILVVASSMLLVLLAGGCMIHLQTQQVFAEINLTLRSLETLSSIKTAPQSLQDDTSVLVRSEAWLGSITFFLSLTLFGLSLRNLLAHREAQSLHAANLINLRRQGKDLKTFQASLDEQRLAAILQTISPAVANDLVALSQVTNDAPPAANSSQESTLASAEQTKTKKILIVDDDPLIRTLLATRLKFYGYLVVTAADVSSAITIASAEIPDLIVLDLCLPDGDGFVVMDRMKEIPALDRIPIVMLSGSDLDANRQHTLENLSISFFQKGQPNRDFLKVIRHALEQPKSLPSAFLSA